ncbi:MAG: DUF4406 domain-containing protein [Treponema sp.]|nr:DUF4406 domain-containing protein [Treponema sp.]
MKVYISGKITGLDRATVNDNFERARAELTEKGHSVLVPTALPDLEEFSHAEYLHICYAMIDVCEAVYMLSDWQTSKGARLELQHASDCKKEILYEDASTKEEDFPFRR